MIINDKKYYTNVSNQILLDKCVKFFSDGCQSYAISFDNKQSDIITTVKIDGMLVNYLRNMNFSQCFIPERLSNVTNSIEILEKGIDLIELL